MTVAKLFDFPQTTDGRFSLSTAASRRPCKNKLRKFVITSQSDGGFPPTPRDRHPVRQ